MTDHVRVEQRGRAAAEILSVLVPSAEQTELLAACLHGSERAREAWARWLLGRDTDDAGVCRDLASTRTLLPLLARATIAGGLEPSPGVGAYLRAATLREELRAERVRTIAAEVLDALREAEAAPLVVRGPALAATVYDDWSLRHCHDLDLLVGREGLPRATDALRRVGCVELAASAEDVLLDHPSGLGIALHTRPFAFAYYDGSGWSDWGSEEIVVAGISARATSPEATLVHVLGHAGYSASQRNLRWVADAWHLVLRRELDWTVFVELVEAHRLELPVSALLRYLIDFGVPVPPDAGERLRESADRAGRVAEDVALGGALAVAQGELGRLWRSSGSRSGRIRLARWAVAPSAAYVRSTFPARPGWLVPLGYAYRPARFAAGRIARRPRA